MSAKDERKSREPAKKPAKPADADSAGVYFMSIEEFEGRPIIRKEGVRTVDPEEEEGKP